jgi:chemotaxis protein methyltransferase CheR
VKVSFESRELDRFREVIADRLGLRFENSKQDELAQILFARMKATSRKEIGAYLSCLATSRDELRALAGHLTVPETYFFRTHDHFCALTNIVLDERSHANSRELRILSAGCASGEEAYSIAMLVRDCLELRQNGVTIRGVDLNPAVIAKARQGRYSEWSMRETKSEIRDRHFRKQGDQFELSEPIRSMVEFEEGNLMDPSGAFWQRGYYDVIFLRNVLMYFSPEAVQGVIERVADSLAPGGYLFLGPAETLRGISQGFHLCHTHNTFYYCRRAHDDDVMPVRRYMSSRSATAEPLAPPASPPEIQGDWLKTIRLASERIEDLTHKRGKSHRSATLKPETGRTPARLTDVSVAMDLLQQERFSEALDALPLESAASTDVRLLRAVALANTGKLAEAETTCKLLLKEDELNAGAHYVMALCLEHAGDRRASAEHDQVAMYLDPSFAMPHLHLGLLARRAEDFVTARRELHQAMLLLAREDASRILLFGGGFSRVALIELCRRELTSCGGKA